jgi:Winged helix DNA-binding domain
VPSGGVSSSSTWALRFGAQLLAGPPAHDAVAVADRLLAIQAQDPRGARLAVRARSAGITAADVDRGLNDRSLLISWLNRGTLHLIRSEDYPLLHALSTPQLASASARRLSQEGVSPAAAQRAVAVICASLASEGPLTREELRDRIAQAGVRTEGQALVHILFRAALLGHVVRGPMIGARHAYVLVADWLGKPRPVERGAALAELGRRYLRGHGPAGDRDLAKWAGITLGDARAALSAIGPELQAHVGGLVDLRRRTGAPALPAPRLLGAFDPVLHGWTSRQDLLGSYEPLVVSGGLFRPFVLVRGRAAGLWKLARTGAVELAELGPLARGHMAAAVQREARDVERFLSPRRT